MVDNGPNTGGARSAGPTGHALSVDVEDWYNVTVLHRTGRVVSPTAAVVRNTERLLDLFQAHGADATWFLLGEVAAAFPGLVRRLAEAGQEIAVHGYHHHFVWSLSEAAFRDSIRRAKDTIEQAAGQAVLGHRAPAFSITEGVPWALDVLAGLGFLYDSSVFPFRGRRYGLEGAPCTPYRVATRHGPLTEVPLAVLDFRAARIPCCGGGYLRHFPLAYTRWALRVLERRQRTAVFYLHPYELDASFDAGYVARHMGQSRSRMFELDRWLQYRNRAGTVGKLRWLLSNRRFGTVAGAFGLGCRPPPAPAGVLDERA
jgi:polysaccharide deacetylase family protein (PEP-CTERM system associated)